ncbi:MAG: SHOCT domain-containing protein [Phycisphaerae bacterium]
MVAQSGDLEAALRALLYAAALLVGMIVMAAALWYYWRRVRQSHPPQQPWSLQQLRQLHASGQLTDQEYQRLRDRLIGRCDEAAKGPAETGQP